MTSANLNGLSELFGSVVIFLRLVDFEARLLAS